MSQFTEEVAIFYNSSLTLHSQPQMELYLGPRYVYYTGVNKLLILSFGFELWVLKMMNYNYLS